ncbi:hypothetical protein DIPPA_24209 [Diplonema papillatum]|nr:hypothetical protein DIPPA_24209 [Diplonema papillatum]
MPSDDKKNRSRTQSPKSKAAAGDASGGEHGALQGSLPHVACSGPSPKHSGSSGSPRSSLSAIVEERRSTLPSNDRDAAPPPENVNKPRSGSLRSRSTPPSHGRPLWGVKLQPLKDAPTLQERSDTPDKGPLGRQGTRSALASLDQAPGPIDRAPPHPASLPLPMHTHHPLRPIEKATNFVDHLKSHPAPAGDPFPTGSNFQANKKLPRLNEGSPRCA